MQIYKLITSEIEGIYILLLILVNLCEWLDEGQYCESVAALLAFLEDLFMVQNQD